MSMRTATLPARKTSTPDERRRSERRPHVVEAWIASPTSPDLADRHEITSVNISRHGVGFMFSQELPVGAFYVTQIGMGAQRIITEIHIISCRKIAKGQFEVGAEFC